MEEICGGLIPVSSNDNSEENYYPLMMKNINNREDEEEEDQHYFYPWLQTSSCISSILMSAATASHDDHEKSGSIFSLQLEGGADDEHESSSSSSSNSSSGGGGGGGDVIIKAKISAHPLYPKLLEASINFHKVGAPPEMANQLEKIVQENASRKSTTVSSYCLGEDPELDEFMETYCGELAKYTLDLQKPYNEATAFLSNMESQLTNLCNIKEKAATTLGDEDGGVCYNDETSSGGETEEQQCLGRSEANEIKEKLLRKYGGYISTLRHEYFSREKKNGKLPSDATHILQNWWSIHYNWPYPTEADKIALAETTGLDQKQINNWFINQRKRHWKPSSDHNFMKPYLSG